MVMFSKGPRMRAVPAVLGWLVVLAAAARGLEHKPGETRYPLRAECAYRLLTEVGPRLQLYARANGGMLPPRLSDAYRDVASGGSGWRTLICPANRPEIQPGGFYPSYAYVRFVPGGRRLRDPAAEKADPDLLVFDAAPVHQGGRNVLLSSMEVVYLDEAEFQKRLAAQRERWKKRGKRIEIGRHDLIPLNEVQRYEWTHGQRTWLQSMHFRIALGLVIAITLVLIALGVVSRRRKREEAR